MIIALRHISFAQIIDLVEGRLVQADQLQAQSHIASCARCAAELARLSRVVELMRADSGEDPPLHVAAQVAALFRTQRAPAPAGLRQRRSAGLHFDSRRIPQPAGLRAGAQSERQLLFNAGDIDVDLQIVQAGELWSIAGQVLGSKPSGQVDLQGAGGAARAALNELGEFRFPPLPAGIYTLTLRLADADIEVAELEVGR
jgi:anti-sigma factor RsiW